MSRRRATHGAAVAPRPAQRAGLKQSPAVAWLVIAFLLGGGAYLTTSGWDNVYTLHRLEQASSAVEGRVLGKATRALSRGGQSWTLVVEYQPEGHPPLTKTFDVNGSTYRAAVASGVVRVTYHPDDPEVSLITKFAILPFQMLLGLGILMLLAGAFCVWIVRRPEAAKGADDASV
ncbi:MAG: hypothetical protein KDH20_19735 [Rhodocyclaceae bacterium]|nr:hypothetical protein [Rhodocyclaceae bacterium]